MARMLIIDNEENLRRILQTVLTRKGHEVFLAENGEKGINVFERIRPSITLLDMRMPDMGGLEVLSHLRSIDHQAYVILLTGGGATEAEIQALSLTADDFLQKGFSFFELGETLRRALARMALRSLPSPSADH